MMDESGPKDQARRPRSGSSVSLWALSGLWLEMLASILGLGLLGYGFDRWLGWFPVLTITGTILGVVGGLYNAIKKAMGFQDPPRRQKNGSSDTRGR